MIDFLKNCLWAIFFGFVIACVLTSVVATGYGIYVFWKMLLS